VWRLVEADFQQFYGIDLEQHRHRTYRWFRVRLDGLLLDTNTRVWRHFAKSPEPSEEAT